MNKSLSPKQAEQVEVQLEKHNHPEYKVDIALTSDLTLKDFIVYPEVLQPDTMTSLFLAQYLHNNSNFYDGKRVIDIGCGSGIQGIVTALNRAAHVTLADISPQAIANTKANINNYQLETKTQAVQSDLFEHISDCADLIIFNHPFFSGNPIRDRLVSIAMLDNGKLIHRFLEEAKAHLNPNGTIVMPYYHLAGETNDPGVQGPKHDFRVTTALKQKVDSGIQQGAISIYILKSSSPPSHSSLY